ncbi:MAG: YqjF family protein [Candidatus Pristimantibacillus sp.]
MIINDQRPWPAPTKSWIMKQSWRDLLFVHYPVKHETLRPHIPMELEIDTYDDYAWISIVPFLMSGIRFRGTPAIPVISQFPELNVRTYVKSGDKPGVYFFSLDAMSALAVFFGNTFFHLPYVYSKMSMDRQADQRFVYESIRSGGIHKFKGSYRPVSKVYQAIEGSLDYWLVERYCLYSKGNNQLYLSEINHEPWQLQNVEYEIIENSVVHLPEINIGAPYCAHYCKRIDVHVWPLEPVASRG